MRNKVIVAIAVPHTKRQFQAMVDRGDSDFLRSLTEVFKTKDMEAVWSHYQKVASAIESNIRQYEKHGAEVIQELTLSHLSRIADADVAIIIAHHSDVKDEIEMADSMVASSDFVEAIPTNFKGLLDLSSCYSSTIQLSIKMRCPECHILAVKSKTPLQMRMTINEYVLKTMAHQPATDYVDIVKSTYAIIMKMYTKGNIMVNPEIVYLGGSIQSSVFAPKQVERGQPFLIQVAIHKSADAEMVEITAREADGSATLRNPLRLSFKLKKNDRVDIVSGKPILVYVMDNYEDKMKSYLPEHQYEVNKQRNLINELGEKRMVEYFSDGNSLALLSSRELTILQTTLQPNSVS